MTRHPRRPLRYWGIGDKGRRPFGVLLTIVMTCLSAIAVLTLGAFAFAIVRGHTHGHNFWSAAVLVALIAFLLLPVTAKRWRPDRTLRPVREQPRVWVAPVLLVAGVALWIVTPNEITWLGSALVGMSLLAIGKRLSQRRRKRRDLRRAQE
jgi:drug/metabolite transporter (DMT)-like permease